MSLSIILIQFTQWVQVNSGAGGGAVAVPGGARVERVRGLSVLVAAVAHQVARPARARPRRLALPLRGEDAHA